MSESHPKPASAVEHPTLSTSMLGHVRQLQPDAWHRLVETFGPIVYGWGRRAGLNQHDAADVVQDVFASVARGIGQFQRSKQSGSFRSWLATITRNRICDYYRRDVPKNPVSPGGTDFQQRLQSIPDDLDEALSDITETDLDRRLPRRVLELVQAEIEPRTWQAFWLTTVEEYSAKEAAGQLDMQLASVYQAKSRVLRRIRQRLEDLD